MRRWRTVRGRLLGMGEATEDRTLLARIERLVFQVAFRFLVRYVRRVLERATEASAQLGSDWKEKGLTSGAGALHLHRS